MDKNVPLILFEIERQKFVFRKKFLTVTRGLDLLRIVPIRSI